MAFASVAYEVLLRLLEGRTWALERKLAGGVELIDFLTKLMHLVFLFSPF